MIIQPEHEHQQTPPKIIPQKAQSIAKSQVIQSPILPLKQVRQAAQAPEIMRALLQSSLQLLSSKGSNQVKEKVKHREEKVHSSFSSGPNQYLNHLHAKNQNEENETLSQIIEIQNWLAANRILQGSLVLREKPDIKTLKNNIIDKISNMKKSLMSLSSIERKASAEFQNLLQFKKKNYWEHETQRGKKVKNFISKMKRIHSEQKKRQEKDLIQRQYKIQVENEKEKRTKQEIRKQIYTKQLQKQFLLRKERMKYSEQQRKKKEEIQVMLQKFNALKPVYMRKQQQFIKNVLEQQQEERQKKLSEIRSRYQPLDQQQIDQHNQRYQQYKENLLEQHRKKQEQQNQIKERLEQELKDLYHCKFHKDIQPRFYSSMKVEKEQKVKKIKQYQKQVLDHHRPTVDPMKRSKLQEHILDLQLKEDKKKMKVVLDDGKIALEDKPVYNARRIGVQYLQNLRDLNQGKPRKKEDRSASMMQLAQSSKIKRIDYLRQNKPNLKLKKTIGEWKKIMEDNTYSPRQRYQCIMEQATVLQEKAHQKEGLVQTYKKGDKAMQLKDEMDKLYLESVAAKLVVLKDVIMKQ